MKEVPMKVVTFNGSARTDGNAAILVGHVVAGLNKKGSRPNWCKWREKGLADVGRGRDPGEVEKDREDMDSMRIPGENMAWLLKKLFPEKHHIIYEKKCCRSIA
jgi:multimeric flavodoxin WrbA